MAASLITFYSICVNNAKQIFDTVIQLVVVFYVLLIDYLFFTTGI